MGIRTLSAMKLSALLLVVGFEARRRPGPIVSVSDSRMAAADLYVLKEEIVKLISRQRMFLHCI